MSCVREDLLCLMSCLLTQTGFLLSYLMDGRAGLKYTSPTRNNWLSFNVALC